MKWSLFLWSFYAIGMGHYVGLKADDDLNVERDITLNQYYYKVFGEI